jgi:hypothetical protein
MNTTEAAAVQEFIESTESPSDVLKIQVRARWTEVYEEVLSMTRKQPRGALVVVHSSIASAVSGNCEFVYLVSEEALQTLSNLDQRRSFEHVLLSYDVQREFILLSFILHGKSVLQRMVGFEPMIDNNLLDKLQRHANIANLHVVNDVSAATVKDLLQRNGYQREVRGLVELPRLGDAYQHGHNCNGPLCSNIKVGIKYCGGCGDAMYCSKECQTKAWSQHKQICAKLKELRKKLKIMVA